MGSMIMDHITVTPLKRLYSPGGEVFHAMKAGDTGYTGFGEAYFSWIEFGKVKAWKKHLQMTLNLVVPVGSVRFVFCVSPESGFYEVVIGDTNYSRLTVSSGCWFGFQGMSEPRSLVLNLADIAHDPDEIQRRNISDIFFNWR